MATITVDLRALTGSFETDMKRAAKQAKSSLADIERAGRAIGTAIAAGVTVGVVSLAALTRQSINTADELAKMAQKVGTSVEALSTLSYAADQSGVSIEKLQGGLVKLAKNASDTAQGIGTASDAFNALGISVTKSDGSLKGTDALLTEIAGALAQYEDGANKTALAVQIFGRAGAELIPLLNSGADGITQMQQRARDLGLELGTDTAKAAEQFNDRLSDMSMLVKGFGNDLTTQLIPGLAALAEDFVNAGIEGRKAAGGADALAEGIRGAIGVAITAGAEIKKLGAIAGAVFQQISTFGPTLQSQLSAVAQYPQDVFDIGPIDAVNKFWETAINNTQQLRSNVDALGESFDAIDEEAERRVAALATGFKDLSKATGGSGGKGAAPAIVSAANATKQLAMQAKEAARQLKAMQEAQNRAVDVTMRLVDEQEQSQQQTDDLLKNLQEEISLIGKSNAEREKAIALRQLGVNATKDEADEVGRLIDELMRGSEIDSILSDIFATSELDGIVQRLAAMSAALQDVSDETSKAFDPKKAAVFQKAVDQLNTQLQVGTLGSYEALLGAVQTFTKEGSKSFNAIKVGMAALSIIQDVIALKAAVTAVLTQGQGEPYSAFARMAAMAAAVAPFIASIGLTLSSFGGGGGPTVGERRQVSQGTGTILGDDEAKSESIINALEITADATSALVGINRGMLRALQALQSGIGGASASIARVEFGEVSLDAGPAMNSILNPFGAQGTIGGRIINGLFGGEQELVDQGLLIAGGMFGDLSRNPDASAFQTIETDGGWFGSDDLDDELTALSESAVDQIRLILTSIGGAVREGAVALGLDLDAVNAAIEAFRIEEIRISTMDLTGEEAQAELQAVFSSIFDGLAGSVAPFIEQFQRVGEGLGETLVRVATGVQVTQEAMTQLGFSLDELGPEAFAQVSEGLIEMAGGLDSFIEGMQTFVAAFATEEHQFALAQDALTSAFAQAGLTLPETRDGMWALMQSLDATTESGREQIATLLRLAGVADDYYTFIERRADDAAAEARAAAAVGELIADLKWDEALAGMTAFERAIAETGRRFDEHIASATAAGASESELAMIRDLGARAAARLIEAEAQRAAEEQARALQAQIDGARSYADVVNGVNDALADLAGSEYQQSLVGIARALGGTIDAMNEAARAAGLQSAREEDLGRAHLLAAMQAARALEELINAGRQQAADLYGSDLGDIDARIAALQDAGTGFAEAITDTASAISDATNLLLGDLSPLKDAQKLPLALQALQRGEIGGEDVLRIAQRLFASGADYNRVFAQVQAIVAGQQGGGSGSQGTGGQEAQIAELQARREALLEEQALSARFGQAQSFAQTLADVAGARGLDFADALALLAGERATLQDLANDLQLRDVDSLTQYLSALQASEYSVSDIASTLRSEFDYLLEGMREIFGIPEEVQLGSIQADPVSKIPDTTSLLKTEEQHDETAGLLRELLARVASIESHAAVTATATEDTAEASRDAVAELQGVRRDNSDRNNFVEAGLPRGVRVPSPREAA